jgi:hypothetical protein
MPKAFVLPQSFVKTASQPVAVRAQRAVYTQLAGIVAREA